MNLIHHQKAVLDLRNEDIAISMTQSLGLTQSKESVGHYFTGNSGVPIEKIGALLASLGLKVVGEDSPEVSQDKLKALKLLAMDGLKDI